jgi:Glycosyltransferase family 87
MPDRPRNAWARPWGKLAALTVLAALLVVLGRAVLPWDAMLPDFISHWTAGKILASGQSPYDVELQTRVQREYGWDKETTGRGTYDFLPFYYPPWFGLAWVLLVPLGFQAAKVAWFFINIELTLVAGYLLHRSVPGVPPRLPMVLAPVFAFSVACVLLGQTAIVVFFLTTLAWRLLQQGRDRSAGVVLAWLTIKPQLTAVLLLGVLLWLARQRRWGAVCAFAVTLAVLCLASTLVVPSWPVQMWEAPRQTPIPTEHYPWIGNAWFLVLRAVGLNGWLLLVLCLAVALPFTAAVLWTAIDRATALSSLLGWGVLAAFFVAPYARHYDFPVLLIPAVLLLDNRLPRLAGTALVAAMAVLPYIQIFLLAKYQPLYDPSRRFLLEATFFWVPLLLAALWAVSRMALRRPSAHPPGLAGAERGGPTG